MTTRLDDTATRRRLVSGLVRGGIGLLLVVSLLIMLQPAS